MEANERTETRKDEIRYRTADTRRMVGRYFADRVCKKWQEEIIDRETGEAITIDRTEILFEGGKYIDEETAQSISFHIQCGDIAEVEVSNQRRLARPHKGYSLLPYKVTVALMGGKKKSFILQAQSAALAIEVATDYAELNYSTTFAIESVKAMPGVILINDRFRRAVDEVEGANEAGEENPDGEEKREDTKYYRIEADITEQGGNVGQEDEPKPMDYDFIVKTRDIDTAKAVITAWIHSTIKKRSEQEGSEPKTYEVRLTAASPFSCNAIIPYSFCVAYKEAETITVTAD